MAGVRIFNNAAGAFANCSSWHEADPNKAEAFAYPVGRERQSRIEEALRALGRQGPASVRGLVDYDGALQKEYRGNWEGRYLITVSDGNAPETLICHAKPFINTQSYALSNDVYKLVRNAGMLAPELLPFANGELVQRVGDVDTAFTNFIPGRPVDPDKNDMWDAGYGIAVFKNVMTSLPPNLLSSIVENSRSITARVECGVDFMLSGDGQKFMSVRSDAPEAKILTGIAHVFQEESAKKVVPRHGDLVPGNYFINEHRTPIFLDFDNVGGSLFPADVDVGTVLHRIGIEKSSDQSIGALKRVFTDVLEGYNDIGLDRGDEMTPGRLARSMQIAIGWKLCGSFGELAGGVISYQGADKKIERFAAKSLSLHPLVRTLSL